MSSLCEVLAGLQQASSSGSDIFNLLITWVFPLHTANGLLFFSFPKTPISLYVKFKLVCCMGWTDLWRPHGLGNSAPCGPCFLQEKAEQGGIRWGSKFTRPWASSGPGTAALSSPLTHPWSILKLLTFSDSSGNWSHSRENDFRVLQSWALEDGAIVPH